MHETTTKRDLLIITTSLITNPDSSIDSGVLSRRFRELFDLSEELDLRPVLVLGSNGDEILQIGEAVADCDFVFDPNFTGALSTSVLAGLFAAQASAFVYDLQHEVAGRGWWKGLLEAEKKTLHQNSSTHIIRWDPTNPAKREISAHLPILVRRSALKFLRGLSLDTNLETDPRIRHLNLSPVEFAAA